MLIQTTIRLTKTLGIAATVVGLLFLPSSNHFYEESPQEAGTVEIELLLCCRKEQPAAKANFNTDSPRFQIRPASLRPLSKLPVITPSERDGMNGIGAYLII